MKMVDLVVFDLLLFEDGLPLIALFLDVLHHVFLSIVVFLVSDIGLNLSVVKLVGKSFSLHLAQFESCLQSLEASRAYDLDLNVDEEEGQGFAPELSQ